MKIAATLFTVFVAHAKLPSKASAFAPVAFRSIRSTSTSSLSVVTGADGKPASSKEEDLKLTCEIILNHVGIDVDDKGASPEASAAAPSDETPKAEKEKKPKKKKTPPAAPAVVNYDIDALDIRVGVINKAWAHEDADKLYCEEIDIGEESGPRTIATGVRAYYSDAEELVGRRVCVLANLKSRKLMGFPSHGMVLCASTESEDGARVVFLEPPEDAAIGERVVCEGYGGEPATANQILKKKILDKVFPEFKTDADGVATYKGVPMTAGSGKCVAPLPNAEIA